MLYITLRQYEYVVSVADAGSLTKAAMALNVSQPSLSVAITRVEQILGSPIFVRGKGAAISITPYGHKVIKDAKKVLEIATATERKTNARPTFVLGCFEDISPWHLAPALKQLSKEIPDVDFQGLEGRFSDIVAGLAEGRMDMAISYDIGFDDSVRRLKITDVFPVAFMSVDHPLAERRTVELAELAEFPLLLSTEELSERFVRNLFDQLQLTPTVRQKVASLEMMRSLAAHDMGVGISYSRPPNDISYDGRSLVTVPICTPAAVTDINLIWSGLREVTPVFDRVTRVIQAINNT